MYKTIKSDKSGRWPADWGFGPSPEDLQSAIVSDGKTQKQKLVVPPEDPQSAIVSLLR